MEKAVVLTSGGIGSAVAAATAREHHEVALLHVAWGHRAAEREQASFQQLAAALKIETTLVVDLACPPVFAGSARFNKRLAIEDATTLARSTPATWTPGFMPAMLSLATSWAGVIGARRIILGISENHATPGPPISVLYPEHRREFIQAFNLMLRYALGPSTELTVEAPLIELNRAEVVKLGQVMKVPFERTWSCYAGARKPCRRCRACNTRAHGFLQARIPDPLLLELAAAAAR